MSQRSGCDLLSLERQSGLWPAPSPAQIQSLVLESQCHALGPDCSLHCCCFLVQNKILFVVPRPCVLPLSLLPFHRFVFSHGLHRYLFSFCWVLNYFAMYVSFSAGNSTVQHPTALRSKCSYFTRLEIVPRKFFKTQ